MEEIYRSCPEFENNDYILRMVSQEDRLDLLKVYSDKEAVSFFNSDNCGGDDFYYTDYEKFLECMKFWESRYQVRDFVRFTIVDQKQKEIAGMVEICAVDDYIKRNA